MGSSGSKQTGSESKQTDAMETDLAGSRAEFNPNDLTQLQQHIDLKVSEIKREEEDNFFDRVDELDRLVAILRRRPCQVTLIVGPVSCGKSALLRKLQRTWEGGARMLQLFAPVLFIDMRGCDFSTPEAAAKQLRKLVLNWADIGIKKLSLVNMDWGPVAVTKQVMGTALKVLKNDFDDVADNIAAVVSVINCYISSHPAMKPIIIIDEADRLGLWPEKDRDTFIGFLKSLSKESERAHVFMASSDDFFRGVIRYHWHMDFFNVFGLGHLGRDDAEEYFRRSMLRYENAPAVSDEMWGQIYAVTGGSMMAMRDVCQKASDIHWDWMSVLKRLKSTYADILMGTLLPNEGSVWTAEQYLKVIEALVAGDGIVSLWRVIDMLCNDYNVDVDNKSLMETPKGRRAMVKKHGISTYQQVLKALASMVKDNRIHLRYVGSKDMYKDITVPSNDVSVTEFIMAIKPYEFAGMKEFCEGSFEFL